MREWLSIIGIGEEGLTGLSRPALQALSAAEVVFGAPRHLAMVTHHDKRAWPVPFDLAPLLALRGRHVAMVVSGDPFWFGAGGSIARHIPPEEWRSHGGPSIFSRMAARLGWRLEDCDCLGLHARPLSLLRPKLHEGAKIMATLRNADAPQALAAYLDGAGFGASRLHIFDQLGGRNEAVVSTVVSAGAAALEGPFSALVACAIEVRAADTALPADHALPVASGLADRFFTHDGQITKRPLRALALSALAPRPGELLWDLGAGSGSIGIEWMLSHPKNRAIGVEQNAARAATARHNACRLGVPDLRILEASTIAAIDTLPPPDAVFIGGGADEPLFERLWQILPAGCRVVAHAVTLETEGLLNRWQEKAGGSLLRIELSEASALGRKRGWKAQYPVVQWQAVR